MSANMGVKVMLVLMCLSLVFSLAPRMCTVEMKTNPDGDQCGADIAVGEVARGWNTGLNMFIDWFGGFTDVASVVTKIAALAAGAVVVTVAASSLFPNAFSLFGQVTAFLVLSFLTVPWGIINETNQLGFGDSATGALVVGFILALFGFLILFATLSFYKGNDF